METYGISSDLRPACADFGAQAWDLGGVLEAVKAAVAAAPLNAFLRVFVWVNYDSGDL